MGGEAAQRRAFDARNDGHEPGRLERTRRIQRSRLTRSGGGRARVVALSARTKPSLSGCIEPLHSAPVPRIWPGPTAVRRQVGNMYGCNMLT